MRPLSDYIIEDVDLSHNTLRFNIAKAYYCFLMDWHEGQWSVNYKRLCKLMKSYKPSLETIREGTASLDPLEQRIYDRLVLKMKLNFTDKMDLTTQKYEDHVVSFYQG